MYVCTYIVLLEDFPLSVVVLPYVSGITTKNTDFVKKSEGERKDSVQAQP